MVALQCQSEDTEIAWLSCSQRGSGGGASREGAVLESGDAFSCWPSGVIWRVRRQRLGNGGLGGGCFEKGVDTAKVPPSMQIHHRDHEWDWPCIKGTRDSGFQ